jgi:hypothetical protein
MLLLQDVSINDVNEVVKKIGKFSSILLLVCLGGWKPCLFLYISCQTMAYFQLCFFSQNDFLHFLPNTLAEVCLKIFQGLWKILNNIDRKKSDVSNNVTLEQFVEYFKNLNELPENEKDQEIGFDSVDRENVHNITILKSLQ